jgi:5-methylcytosine-specific restriction endonuclease McrA
MRTRKRFTRKERRHVYLADAGLCRYCRKPVAPWRFDVAHEVPFSKGGSDEYWNLALAHEKCNRSAGAERLDLTTGDVLDRLSTMSLAALAVAFVLAVLMLLEAVL